MSTMRVALATTPGSELISQDDPLLLAVFEDLGIDAVRAVWDDPTIEWSLYDHVAIRTTWDYHVRLEEFLGWIKRITTVTLVHNDPRLIPWNAHKAYLIELAERGVPIVPTCVLSGASAIDPAFQTLGGSAVVVKPEVGASAQGARRFGAGAFEEVRDHTEALLTEGKVLMQTYLSAIETEGELSLAWIGGEIAHAVQKTPAKGDFRIQVEHGGSNRRVAIPNGARSVAGACIAALEVVPTFARIDLVQNDAGDWLLMELELIEPELMLEWAPESALKLAEAIIRGR